MPPPTLPDATVLYDAPGLAVDAPGGEPDSPPFADAPPSADAAPLPEPDAAAVVDAAPPPDAPPPLPCMGIPASGVCATNGTIDHCVYPELGDPYVETLFCAADERCATTSSGAQCVLAIECREGDTECVDATHIRGCIGGHWSTATCARNCLATPLGDVCGLDAPTRALSGTLRYEARGPNESLTDWGALGVASAQGFLVLSARLPGDGSIIPTDVTFTGYGPSAGQFTVLVPTTPQPSDALFFMAVRPASDQRPALVLADPALPPSSTPYSVGAQETAPPVWYWGWATAGLAEGQTLTITEALGGGAARVFDVMRYAWEDTAFRYPGSLRLRLIAWLGGGVKWDCGACFVQALHPQFGAWFGGQIWLNGGPDREYYADSVTAHELGHWSMASYGHVVGEFGAHSVNGFSLPGLAWSEGYATWFSADLLGSPLYVDKQNGTMFWLDIGARQAPWIWPSSEPQYGLYQLINENEVAAMLWNLSATQNLGGAPLDAALASARMTLAPFLRRYVTPAGVNTTFLADFLDALVCDGLAASAVDLATQPATRYPYPSASPLCRAPAPRAPATLSLVDEGGVLRAHLERHAPWPYPVTLTFRSRAGVLAQHGADDATLALAGRSPDDVVAVADSQGAAGGFHAEARVRPAPPPPPPKRSGQPLRLGNLWLGAPIRGDVR